MEQYSEEWWAARVGNITASKIKDVLAKIKSGESATRSNYKAQLVAERMTGQVEQSYTNAAMQHGTDTEPLARASYEIATGFDVNECGYIKHPSIARSGASPDGLVGDDGLLEIKAPNTATHFKYILNGVAPSEYIPQMAWQIACTGRKWCDFVSFDPRVAFPDQLLIVRYTPEQVYLDEITQEVIKFDIEVEEMIKSIKGKRK